LPAAAITTVNKPQTVVEERFTYFIRPMRLCMIMESVFSAAARRTTSPERFAQGRTAPVR